MANKNTRRGRKELRKQIAAVHRKGALVSAPPSLRKSHWKGHVTLSQQSAAGRAVKRLSRQAGSEFCRLP
jgi:hypothetical protein